MPKNKNEFDKNNDELDKSDVIIASTLTISLVIGLLISGIVLIGMAG